MSSDMEARMQDQIEGAQHESDIACLVQQNAELRAEVERLKQVRCAGIPRMGCDYLQQVGTLCPKCGETHTTHSLLQMKGEVERLRGMVPKWVFQPINPCIPAGSKKEFLVAVKRGGIDKRFVFTATYMDDHFLSVDDWSDPEANDDGEKPFTGWYSEQENSDGTTEYVALCLGIGDELIAWCEKPSPPEAPHD